MANSPHCELPLSAVNAPAARPPQAMVAAMREGGWFGPLGIVRPSENGKYELICGRRRVAAARAAGWTSGGFILATNCDAALLRLRENACRAANPAAAYRDVLALSEAGMSYTEISRATGITRSQIAKLMRLRGLSPALMAKLEAGEISANLAFEAATLPEEEQAKLAQDERPTIPKVRALKTARLKAVNPPPIPEQDAPPLALPEPALWQAILQLAQDVRDGVEPPERLINMILRSSR